MGEVAELLRDPPTPGINGIAFFLDTEQVAIRHHVRVAERVFGVDVVHKRDGVHRSYVGVHGLHSSVGRRQLAAADAWVDERAGCVVLDDFNGLVCSIVQVLQGQPVGRSLPPAAEVQRMALHLLLGWPGTAKLQAARGRQRVGSGRGRLDGGLHVLR